jgi:hypothetical protein
MLIDEQYRAHFASEHYIHINQIVAQEERSKLLHYAIARSKTPTMSPDRRVPGTPAASADPRMEELLERLLPAIERITGCSLFPTYSYFRVYKTGDMLVRHTDRMACEISVSLSLGYRPDSPWPICIQGPKGAGCVEMQPGDAVVYRGIDCPHWREPFKGKFAAQVFLHYVDQNGPFATWKFDKRKRLGSFPKGSIRISKTVLSSADGVLLVESGKKWKLDALEALIWKDLEGERSLVTMAEHVQQALHVTEPEAELAIMKFISRCEDKGLLFF